MHKLTKYLILTIFLVSSSAMSQNSSASQNLYRQLKPKIVQIKILNNKTEEKSSIGSGFVIEKSNLIATNYHVISQIANEPDDYHGQYRTTNNELGDFELVAFDVINDLALLRVDKPLAEPLVLASLPEKGASLFSLGNPLDLGFVIVDGVNNGIIPKQDPPRIFFSASINSGMSGGPSVNEEGGVVAVNVAVRRDSGDISFLVPAGALKKLIEKAAKKKFTSPKDLKKAYADSITQQLIGESKVYFTRLDAFQRDYIVLGELRLPSQIGPDFKCWSLDDDERDKARLIESSGVSCGQSRSHYINSDEQQGSIGLVYSNIKAKEPLTRRRFYRYVTRYHSDNFLFRGKKDKDEHNVKCTSDFVYIAEHEFKMHICTQPDKKRQGLSRTRVLAISVDLVNEAWVIRMDFQGSTTKEALSLSQSILADIKSSQKSTPKKK